MYVVPLLMFVVAKGRDYYLAPTYPMLYAAGSVVAEAWLESVRSRRGRILRSLLWTVLVVDIAFAAAFALPLTPINSAWFKMASKVNGDFQCEPIGWPELVETVARIRDSLPAQDRLHLGIATNYGEAGAVNLYGTQYGLPRAISGVNSFWEQGYGDPPPRS